MNPNDLLIYEPDPRMFESPAPNINYRMMREKQISPVFTGMHTPKEGGIYIKYQGNLYPEAGIKYPSGGYAVALIKKILLILLTAATSFSINKTASHIAELCLILMDRHFMLKRFYIPVTKGVRQLSYLTLYGIGINKWACSIISKTACHFVQFDDQYRGRVQDIFTMTTKERLMNSPRRELLNLHYLYKRREHADDQKLGSIFKILAYLMYWPKFKRSFIRAVKLTDITLLQFKPGDIYHVLVKGKYDFCGVPVETRKQTYLKLHNGKIPPWIEIVYE